MIPASTTFRNSDVWSPEWLVSVRNLAEASVVSRFGVDILDLKEPSEGALAPVKSSMLSAVGRWGIELSQSHPSSTIRFSAALGEPDQSHHLAPVVPPQFAFAKSGPSGLRSPAELREHWARLRRLLPPSVELVGVAYADHERAQTIPPEQVLESAIEFGLSRVLVDTFTKQSGSAIDLLGESRLAQFGRDARQANKWWSIAGSITLETIVSLRQSNATKSFLELPDCVAVRGAICEAGREGNVCEKKLQQWENSRSVGFAS